MSIRDKIKEYIRELVRRELEEASVTGNLDGGAGPPKTPYMFQSKPKSKKDKEKEKKIAQAGGYMKVDEARFAVDFKEAKKNKNVLVTHQHLNDNTIAGIELKNKKCFSVQYHPEAGPGPNDGNYLFDQFLSYVKSN